MIGSKNSRPTGSGSPKTAMELLDLYYLDARAHLLETAAIFDRVARAPGGAQAFEDPRIRKLTMACGILKSSSKDRAEQFLRLLSR
jgi:hypothetical protein